MDNRSLITPPYKRKIILSIAHKMDKNKSQYSLEFLSVVNYKLLKIGIITMYVFLTYRQT